MRCAVRMKSFNKNNWKQNIDPAFDKFIKSYLDVINALGLTASEGYVSEHLQSYIKAIGNEGYSSFLRSYEETDVNNLINMMTDSFTMPHAFSKLKPIFDMLDIEDWGASVSQELDASTEPLPPMSRDYYLKWKSIPDPNRNIASYIHFVSDIISLMNHLTNIKMEGDNNPVTDIDAYVIQRILFTALKVISISIHKQPIRELYEKAKQEDDASLFRLIQLDKTLFDHEWVRLRIRKAMYSGDKQFFKSLADAIEADPLQHRKIKIERHLVLMNFWFYGLYRLTIPELMQLLQDSGISIPEDEVTFRKFIDREIKPYYKELHFK